MPLYEYVCQSCKQKFDSLRTFSQADQPITCPTCGKSDAKRQLSLVNAFSSGSNLGGSNPCSSCASGNCSSCGH